MYATPHPDSFLQIQIVMIPNTPFVTPSEVGQGEPILLEKRTLLSMGLILGTLEENDTIVPPRLLMLPPENVELLRSIVRDVKTFHRSESMKKLLAMAEEIVPSSDGYKGALLFILQPRFNLIESYRYTQIDGFVYIDGLIKPIGYFQTNQLNSGKILEESLMRAGLEIKQ